MAREAFFILAYEWAFALPLGLWAWARSRFLLPYDPVSAHALERRLARATVAWVGLGVPAAAYFVGVAWANVDDILEPIAGPVLLGWPLVAALAAAWPVRRAWRARRVSVVPLLLVGTLSLGLTSYLFTRKLVHDEEARWSDPAAHADVP